MGFLKLLCVLLLYFLICGSGSGYAVVYDLLTCMILCVYHFITYNLYMLHFFIYFVMSLIQNNGYGKGWRVRNVSICDCLVRVGEKAYRIMHKLQVISILHLVDDIAV